MKPGWLVLAALLLAGPALSWSGTDQDGNSAEIGRGELVRPGLDMEVEIDGETRNLSVDSMRRYGGRVEIEGTDENGNSVTLDMDGD
jgi:hypothetical protein